MYMPDAYDGFEAFKDPYAVGGIFHPLLVKEGFIRTIADNPRS